VDYHAATTRKQYRKSGLALTLVLIALDLVFWAKGAPRHLLLVSAGAWALLAWFELQPVRLAVDLLMALGNVMQRFTNPLVFGLIYLSAVVPAALILKLTGKDLLRLKYDRDAASYWLPRQPTDWKNSFKHPF